MGKLSLVFAGLLCVATLYSQETITESNYLKEDSILWYGYENRHEELSRLWDKTDKRDSIQSVFDAMYEKACKENIRLAVKYVSVPSGLQRLYMVRFDMPKDTLDRILNALNVEIQGFLW